MPKPGYNKFGQRVIVEEHINKPRKSRAAMQTLRANTPDKMKDQLKTVLARDIAHLLRASYDGKLNQVESQSLVTYFKLISELKADEVAEMSSLSDDELKRIENEES